MSYRKRRIERLEVEMPQIEGSTPADKFTPAEARQVAEWAARCARHYLGYRYFRADGSHPYGIESPADDPWIVYMDACCAALGAEARQYGDHELPVFDPAEVIDALPYLELFFHVPGNAEWRDRRAWWIALRDDQIPATWAYYRSCQPAPNHQPFATYAS